MYSSPILRSVSAVAGIAVLGAINAKASTDYGPAIWTPACSSHWYTTGNGHKFHVVHDMEGYYLTTISYFQSCSTSASVHYCINGQQDTSTDSPAGEVTQMVSEANYAWHVLCWNLYCTGTEHEGFESNPAWYTEAQYQSSADLSRHIADKFGYAKDRNHIVGHNEWQNANWRSYATANFGINASCNTHTDPGPYWDWSHYMSLIVGGSGTLASHVDCFIRNSDGTCLKKSWVNGIGWYDFVSIGGSLASAPDAASRGNNDMQVVARNSSGHLIKNSWSSASGWSGWQDLGGSLTGDPTIVCMDSTHVDIFCRGTDGALWKISYLNPGWSTWQSLGGQILDNPDASSRGSGYIDVFSRGTNNHLMKISYTNPGWSAWQDLGETLTSGPGTVSNNSTTVDVFWRGSDGALWKKTWVSGSGWTTSQSLGGALVGGPDASSRGSGYVDVFCRGTDNHLYKKSWTSTSGWSAFQDLGGGTLNSDPGTGAW